MTTETILTIKGKVKDFLSHHFQGEKPLLLGFSGGGDSLALAHLFLELNTPFHLAHFDHSWREQSQRQAVELARWAEKWGVPFHTEQSRGSEQSELAARNERYTFFEEFFKKAPFQALVLAHHAGDQAETVLKRLLEGAHFHNFRAMQPIALRGDIPVWRPLLGVTKEQLLLYLGQRGHVPIEDETNLDRKYMRARMRLDILPYLTEKFGKNVAPPLARLSDYGNQLTDYLEEKTKQWILQSSSRGPYFDFSGAHPVEIDFVLSKSLFPTPSHHSLKKIHQAIQKKSRNLPISESWLVDRDHLFWIK